MLSSTLFTSEHAGEFLLEAFDIQWMPIENKTSKLV